MQQHLRTCQTDLAMAGLPDRYLIAWREAHESGAAPCQPGRYASPGTPSVPTGPSSAVTAPAAAEQAAPADATNPSPPSSPSHSVVAASADACGGAQ
jgi:hypothetical protein